MKNAGCSSPLRREITPDHGHVINMEEGALDLGSREADRFDVSRNGDDQCYDGNNFGMRDLDRSNGPSLNSRENEKDARTVETSGSDSSPTRGKNPIDRMDVDLIKGSSFEETAEEEKIDAMHSEEKQQRKRKRTIMNDKQIGLIESALVDEPDMHRNAPSLRWWADKLSLHVSITNIFYLVTYSSQYHFSQRRLVCIASSMCFILCEVHIFLFISQGAEVTTSRLKNW